MKLQTLVDKFPTLVARKFIVAIIELLSKKVKRGRNKAMKDVTIKEEIVEKLKNMGFNFSHLGTIYLVEAIEIIHNSENPQMSKSIEKNVYVLIAKKYCKKESTIKSDIIKATNFMNEQIMLQRKKTDIYYNLYPKMTPKSVINTVLLKLSA